ncbi:hypothetical protein AA23498_1588 [Acetobacter nitrogenifigens DSM 23921 = NBRC 105050]|uniref:Rieske domain-containing protein n=1 Tax=Acetobacter nitrogenifigens DSM 23921 = NBRC 105050 TaxID=1120919 RepID=A0A511XB49_9PROT|nr:hypothetical protein AA23498_1588 [Acetobacter nitrogenifigens DSM 23921 = NBRC 105050]GEN60170.1 hypothetical protein ANI02nite_20540 [Acetobacter nitrogenifigens DSM 23921 = NBRC 105050]
MPREAINVSNASILTVGGPLLPRGRTFETADWRILAGCWHPVTLVRDVGAKPLGVTLLGAPLVVYKAGKKIVIAEDLCPHSGVPLSMGGRR